MTAFAPADTLHRLVKQALDSGAASSVAEAEALFAGYRLALRLDEEVADDPHHQAALLTAVALARRVFLGGVTVVAPGGGLVRAPIRFGRTLGQAIRALGGEIGPVPEGIPVITIGAARVAEKSRFHIRAVFAG